MQKLDTIMQVYKEIKGMDKYLEFRDRILKKISSYRKIIFSHACNKVFEDIYVECVFQLGAYNFLGYSIKEIVFQMNVYDMPEMFNEEFIAFVYQNNYEEIREVREFFVEEDQRKLS